MHIDDLVQRPEVARRFRFCLWVLVVLMLARIGHWGAWGWLFSAVTNCCAALLPIAALVLSEGLLRRHAPPILKQTCAWGAVLFGLLGLFQFSSLEVWRLAGLLCFQLAGLGGVALFVLRRERESMSLAENRTIDRISFSFLLILPFLATDFMRGTAGEVPVRLGGVAVLTLCWLSVGLNRSGLRAADILRSFAAVFVMGGLLTLVMSGLVTFDLRSGLQILAVTVATVVLLAIWQATIALRIEDRQQAALREIAQAQGEGTQASLAFLRRAAAAPDAVLVEEADLPDMSLDDLRAQFAVSPVQWLGATEDEQVTWLFSRFDATHAVLMTATPFRVVMLNSPDIAALDSTGATLHALQRMAGVLATERQS